MSNVITHPGIVRLGTKDLLEMGYSEWEIKGIRAAGRKFGDSPFRGRFTTPALLSSWLKKHPDFVPWHHLKKISA